MDIINLEEMVMPFNYERFISNINNIITMKGFKVGDIEKKAGVSVGYISKLSSRNTEGGPSTAVTFNIAKALGVSVEPNFGPDRAGDIKHSNADITKAKEMLGYDPDWSFDRGIKSAIEWYKSNL